MVYGANCRAAQEERPSIWIGWVETLCTCNTKRWICAIRLLLMFAAKRTYMQGDSEWISFFTIACRDAGGSQERIYDPAGSQDKTSHRFKEFAGSHDKKYHWIYNPAGSYDNKCELNLVSHMGSPYKNHCRIYDPIWSHFVNVVNMCAVSVSAISNKPFR